jgi:hypothetical protein
MWRREESKNHEKSEPNLFMVCCMSSTVVTTAISIPARKSCLSLVKERSNTPMTESTFEKQFFTNRNTVWKMPNFRSGMILGCVTTLIRIGRVVLYERGAFGSLS